MIIKTLLNSIKINNYTYVIIFLCIITGLFKELIAISLLLIIHELGHFFTALLFKWNVKKIVFYPFGGLTIFEEKIDKPLYQEFLITIMGPIFQIIFYIFIYYLNKQYYVSDYFFSIIKNYNYGILILNILPIIPLDGSKLFNIVLNRFFCFRKSYILTLFISLFGLILLFSYIKNDFSFYMIFLFLLYKLIDSYKNRNYIFNKFILEKKIYCNEYKKYKKINNIKRMFRNKRHLIKIGNLYFSEKKILKKY